MKHHHSILAFAFLVLLVLAPGCYTTQYVVPPEQERSDYDIIGSFEAKKRASWVILGLVPIKEAEVEQIVAGEVEKAGGDAATNVVVTAQFDAVDVLVSAVLGGLYNSRSYTVTGNVVRLRQRVSAAPARPSKADSSVLIGGIQYK